MAFVDIIAAGVAATLGAEAGAATAGGLAAIGNAAGAAIGSGGI